MVDLTNQKLQSFETGDPVPSGWRTLLLERARPIQASKGKIILQQGDESTDVYYIIKGLIRFSRVAINGRETILRDLGIGHLFGELSAIDLHPRSVTAIAIEDCILARLSSKEFYAFLRDVPDANFWVLKQIAGRIRNLTEKTFQLATMSVSSRVLYELLRLSLENGIKNDVSIIKNFPTHAMTAARIGTNREGVTKELRALVAEGIITQSGRTLTIISVEQLQKSLSQTLQ